VGFLEMVDRERAGSRDRADRGRQGSTSPIVSVLSPFTKFCIDKFKDYNLDFRQPYSDLKNHNNSPP